MWIEITAIHDARGSIVWAVSTTALPRATDPSATNSWRASASPTERSRSWRSHTHRLPGNTFVDDGRRTHIGRNETSGQVMLSVTYLVPMGAEIRLDQPDPGTGC